VSVAPLVWVHVSSGWATAANTSNTGGEQKRISLRGDERDRADYNKLGWERAAAWAACLEAKFEREVVAQTWAEFYAERLVKEREQATAERGAQPLVDSSWRRSARLRSVSWGRVL
jgi:hypothetical protein